MTNESNIGQSQDKFKNAYTFIYFIGFMTVLVGCLGQFKIAEMMTELGFNFIDIILGLIFLGLGFWVHKKHSKPALIAAIVLFGLSLLLSFAPILYGQVPPVLGIVIKIIILRHLFGGLTALDQIRMIKQQPEQIK